MIDKIPIHWLHVQAYCEYQLYLEHVKGIEVEPTPEMQTGKEIHTALEEEHEKKAELEITTKDAIKKAAKDKVTLIGREIPVTGKHIYGLIDEIHFMPKQIVIIDDKPNDYPYFSNKKQVWGYCLAFEEQFKVKKTIFAAIRQSTTQEIIWQENFLDEHRNNVIESVNRILGIINGERTPEPTVKLNKCRSCRFGKSCEVFNKRF
ncbi:MAG: Dna2/Cas4 domain-containing protein [Candidatus Aenigmarchaeota archaeon]|nr:Dna2/Cas4 domain-containing protein [Candidatus Aenigmarchaeota archaeon]